MEYRVRNVSKGGEKRRDLREGSTERSEESSVEGHRRETGENFEILPSPFRSHPGILDNWRPP